MWARIIGKAQKSVVGGGKKGKKPTDLDPKVGAGGHPKQKGGD